MVIAAGVTMVITLTACDADSSAAGSPPTEASSAPQTVVSKQTAQKLVDTYERINNRANKARDEKLLATVEGGQLNEQSRADYEQWATMSQKEQQRYASPFHYTNRTYYLPRSGSATWFAVKAASTGGTKDESMLVFDRIGGAYKLVAAVYAEDEPIPDIAVDQRGFATPVDTSQKVGALAPDRLGPALADLLETGGKKEGRQLATTEVTKESVKDHRERNKGEDGSWRTLNYFSAKPAHPKTYALRLADGGVLSVFPFAFNAEFLHKQYMHGGVIIPGKTEAVYNAKRRPVITDEYQGQAMAVLPEQGKPQVIAQEYTMVDSR
ncbi:hypothetical protein [Streptomyces sp. S.PNR 29]|uniref:hypothetical protein n=1 Tax=Streptomyces sp. S.PNR 29 TaxID=2973805 RepID=UPI0025B23270|nr:hypothetical protein [Streptomyces sp. S.PNR 29]MDN0195131.1 hypothetical protein [Streptomyces sp. S.PNR 29]